MSIKHHWKINGRFYEISKKQSQIFKKEYDRHKRLKAAEQEAKIAKELTGVDTVGKYALHSIKTDIREAAEKNEFDALLISSYKLVEKCDVTPFLIEWLINKDIEVWCIAEGKQSIGDQVDKLLKYIHFWEADKLMKQ